MNKLMIRMSPFFIATLIAIPTARAEQASDFDANYKLSITQSEAEERISKQVEKGTEDMNFIKRPIARAAIKKYALPLVTRIKIKRDLDSVTLNIGDRPPITSKNGVTQDTLLPSGHHVKTTVKFNERTITVVDNNERGDKTFNFVFSRNNTKVNVTYTITSPGELTKPISVTLPYRIKS